MNPYRANFEDPDDHGDGIRNHQERPSHVTTPPPFLGTAAPDREGHGAVINESTQRVHRRPRRLWNVSVGHGREYSRARPRADEESRLLLELVGNATSRRRARHQDRSLSYPNMSPSSSPAAAPRQRVRLQDRPASTGRPRKRTSPGLRRQNAYQGPPASESAPAWRPTGRCSSARPGFLHTRPVPLPLRAPGQGRRVPGGGPQLEERSSGGPDRWRRSSPSRSSRGGVLVPPTTNSRAIPRSAPSTTSFHRRRVITVFCRTASGLP